MKRMIFAAVAAVCLLSLAAAASADTLILRDGTRIEGNLVSFAARTITFKGTNLPTRKYATSLVEAIEFLSPQRTTRGNGNGNNGNGNANNNGYGNNNGNNNAYGANGAAGTSGRYDDPRSGVSTIAAPVGTELDVRTTEAIDSRDTRPNQKYAALVESDVVDAQGRLLIPARSRAVLVVREMSTGGTTGSPEMMLDVESITVDGRRYQVSTTDLSQDNDSGLGQNKRTAEAVGGGAAIGSIIGAIAGGGKGAAIGVLVGAAGGAGAQVLTRGKDVRVPAETVLKFRLDRSVTLQADR